MKMDSVVHFEMGYDDPKRVSDFYEKVFGWKMSTTGADLGNYVIAETTETDEETRMTKTPGAINGGFYDRKQVDSKNQTVHVVISVDDLDEAIAKVKESGGEITSEAMDIPGIGKYASIKDTEGNPVGILQPSQR